MTPADLYSAKPVSPLHKTGLDRWDRMNFEMLCILTWWQTLAEYL